MLKLALFILIVFVAQAVFTYFQINDYKKTVSEVSKKGNLFIGHERGRLKAGSIVIMAVDHEGNILDSRSMTGITVFNRFKPVKELIGKNINDSDLWLDDLQNRQMVKAIKKGLTAIKEKGDIKSVSGN